MFHLSQLETIKEYKTTKKEGFMNGYRNTEMIWTLKELFWFLPIALTS